MRLREIRREAPCVLEGTTRLLEVPLVEECPPLVDKGRRDVVEPRDANLSAKLLDGGGLLGGGVGEVLLRKSLRLNQTPSTCERNPSKLNRRPEVILASAGSASGSSVGVAENLSAGMTIFSADSSPGSARLPRGNNAAVTASAVMNAHAIRRGRR